MEIIEQIGSYAGLAAVLGLAVLSALYFSQARDVRRLREWAGRAPERTGEPAPPQAQRVVAQPVPQPPGRTIPPGSKPAPAGAAKPAAEAPAVPAPAAAAAAGAAPATASGPATPAAAPGAATPAGARAAEKEGVSQDTVVHPPPAAPGGAPGGEQDDEGEGDGTEEGNGVAPAAAAAGAAAGAAGVTAAPQPDVDDEDDEEHFGDADDGDLGDEEADDADDADVDADDDDDLEDDDVDEDTGDRPAVAAPNLPPRRPVTAAGARRPVPPPALPARAAPPGRGTATGPILPPYAQSRPGGQPDSSSPEPSGRRTAIMAIVGGLLLLVGVGFGATQILGDEEGGSQSSGASQQQGASGEADNAGQSGGDRGRNPVDPGNVTVAVLNGTTVPGLAAQIGDSIESEGYQLGTITNSTDQQRAESVVLYAPGAESEARDVARRLNISQREEADPDSQGLAGDATVIVVAGQDKTR